jgi:phospholipid transport system substrate-binding protein
MTTIVIGTSPRRGFLGGALAALAGLLVLCAVARPGAAQTADDPVRFVRDFGERAVAMMADPALAPDQRRQTFRLMLVEDFDIETAGRFVLGRAWRGATAAQRSEYLSLFEGLIVATYTRQLESYGGESLAVDGLRSRDEKRAVVATRILRAEGAPIRVDWRLRRLGQSWRIIDVVVEGVSMAITQRSEFKAALRASGGKIEGLLAKLREKAEPIKAASAMGAESAL